MAWPFRPKSFNGELQRVVEHRDTDFVDPHRRVQIASLDQTAGEIAVPVQESVRLAREVEYLRGIIADQDELDGLAQLSMGTGYLQIQPGQNAVITTRPQWAAIQLRRLFIAELYAASFHIVDIRIGNTSKMRSADLTPAMMFCRGIGHAFSGVVETAQDIVMEVVNIGDKPMSFLATWTVRVLDQHRATPAIREPAPAAPPRASSLLGAWYEIIKMPPPAPGEMANGEMTRIVDSMRAAAPEPAAETLPQSGSRRPAVPTGDRLIGWDPYGDD